MGRGGDDCDVMPKALQVERQVRHQVRGGNSVRRKRNRVQEHAAQALPPTRTLSSRLIVTPDAAADIPGGNSASRRMSSQCSRNHWMVVLSPSSNAIFG